MMIKQKSLIVALTSGFLISLVLILTLVGYLAYIEFKGEEFRRSYSQLLQKANAKVYSKHIVTIKLSTKIERSGALIGKPVIEGTIKNIGQREITGLLINVKFLDRDGATIYEEAFYPHEPSLGASGLPIISISYLYNPAKTILRSGDTLSFKRILSDCPKEIETVLKEDRVITKDAGRWSGKLILELLSISF